MCGIFAVINDKTGNASQTVLDGLKRLEYRGYDSWGIAVESNNKLQVVKEVGKISAIKKLGTLPKSTVAIGHTRWATTGEVTRINAHPHYSQDRKFVLAQNGIVENFEELKEKMLKKGRKFFTQTDTEVIVNLVEEELIEHDLLEAVRMGFLKLTGRNTIVVLEAKSGEVIAARNGSPLVIGIGNDGATYISSDVLSFAPFANKMIVIDNGQMVHIKKNNIAIFDIKSNKPVPVIYEDLNIDDNKVDKEGYKYFLLKEINDCPFVLDQLVKQNKSDIMKLVSAIKSAHQVYTIGSGTTGVAASQIAFYLREYAKINAISLVGADARDYFDLFQKNDLVIAPSQSGETADVLEVLEEVKKKGVKIASYVNMPGSAMTRLSDYKFMTKAGPEICVLSTKVFISQIAWGYLLAKSASGKYEKGIKNIKSLSKQIKEYLDDKKNSAIVEKLAEKILKKDHIFLLGKYQNFQIMREGMVKIIEATYKHAHAIPAGDLKHYAITLMEKGVPVIVALSDDKVRWDVINAINEVRLRGANVIGISPENNSSFDFHLQVPEAGELSAAVNVIPLWLLSYYIGIKLDHNVDKPRNIAKSVTVK